MEGRKKTSGTTKYWYWLGGRWGWRVNKGFLFKTQGEDSYASRQSTPFAQHQNVNWFIARELVPLCCGLAFNWYQGERRLGRIEQKRAWREFTMSQKKINLRRTDRRLGCRGTGTNSYQILWLYCMCVVHEGSNVSSLTKHPHTKAKTLFLQLFIYHTYLSTVSVFRAKNNNWAKDIRSGKKCLPHWHVPRWLSMIGMQKAFTVSELSGHLSGK